MLGEITEAKDIGCVVEVVMPAVSNGLGSLIAPPGDDEITKVPANTAAYND